LIKAPVRLVQIIGFLPLIGPAVATLAAQVLQHLHLHGHRQAALLVQGYGCLKTRDELWGDPR
jgi:hypothetical protein